MVVMMASSDDSRRAGRGGPTVIRPERPAGYASIRQVNELAFRQPQEARLVEALRPAPGSDPELSRVAEVGGRVVGHILFSPIVISGPHAGFAALALAPMAVLPEWQRRRVGSALVRDGLEACRRRGHRYVVVLGHAE